MSDREGQAEREQAIGERREGGRERGDERG